MTVFGSQKISQEMLSRTFSFFLSLMLLMHFSSISTTDVQCDPAEIGTNHNISCSSSVVNNNISWTGNVLGDVSPLYQCWKNETCAPTIPTFSTSYIGKIEYINSAYKSTLTIKNVRPTTGLHFQCTIDAQSTVDVCKNLQIFSKPEGVQCNENLKINDEMKIPIICFLTGVYPLAKISTKYNDLNQTNMCGTGPNVTCQIDISVVGFKVNLNFIDVLLYPDVSNGEKYGVGKQLNISLTFPRPSLRKDCLNILTTTQGYIKQGTPANCTCYVKTQGVPPGGVKWFYNNGTVVEVINGSESAVLQVKFTGKETNQSYSCVGVSVLGVNQQGVDFMVKNAYGPEQISLFTSDNASMYDICLSNKSINIICSIPRQSVTPEPSVKINLSINTVNLIINADHNTTHYNYMSHLTKTVGTLSIICEAFNSIFCELKKSATLTTYIAGPPPQPPFLIIGKQVYIGNYSETPITLKEGSDVEITCQVSGGFPNTYNMTLSCDDGYMNSYTKSDVVKLTIQNVGRLLNGKQCVCKAEHVTSCYVNNTSSVTLNITFLAEVHLTANNNDSLLTVSNNSDITFVCDSESNPPATVEISKTETITANTGKVNFTKQVMCQDSGEYVCKAHNSEFIKPVQSCVKIYVQCSLQLKNAHENCKVIPAFKESDAVITFDVLGFPPPVSYSLFKNKLEYKYIVASNSSDSSAISRYQFEYLPNSVPYGSVRVMIFNLTDVDFTNYSLIINNGINTELKLCFILKEGNANIEDDIDILPAATGGGIGCFGFVIVIIIIFIVRVNNQQLWKKIKITKPHQHAEQEHQNSDIYIFKSKNGSGMEINYKNYSDVPITITTATALPKNLNVKSKPALKHTYFNSIDDYSNEFSVKKADKTHLIQKEIKKNDPAVSYAKDISDYKTSDSDMYANT